MLEESHAHLLVRARIFNHAHAEDHRFAAAVTRSVCRQTKNEYLDRSH
jgi:hypothetical protein